MTNMPLRIIVGLIGIPAIVACIWIGGLLFDAIVVVISMLALKEFYLLAESKHATANRAVGYTWSIVLQGVIVVATSIAWPWWSDTSLMLIMGAFVLGVVATLLAELWRAKENALLNVSVTVMGVAYVTVCLSSLMLMHGLPESAFGDVTGFGSRGAVVVLIAFASVWACDTAAYFVGLSIGRHKLFPRVSPKKSWEGSIGGGLAAVATFAGLSAWLMPAYPLPLAIIGGVVVGVFGQIGDLAESLLKRDAAIKDSSTLIPGHGGFMDRFDSMLVVAPLLLAYMLVSIPFVWPVLRSWME